MILSDFIKEGKIRLSAVYDDREAGNILNLVLEEKLELKKHEIEMLSGTRLEPAFYQELNSVVERLKNYEPVQYILGEADFYGLKFKVNNHVLIPRPETEELVELVIREVKSFPQPSILDIGTGSGCIAISLKKNLLGADVSAIDFSSDALQVAVENAEKNSVKIDFSRTDFLNESEWMRLPKFNVIVSNPPYVTSNELLQLQPQVINFEPKSALIAHHQDPFIFYRKIAVFAKEHLSEKGKIFLEQNSAQSEIISNIFKSAGWKAVEVIKDMHGKERVLSVSVL